MTNTYWACSVTTPSGKSPQASLTVQTGSSGTPTDFTIKGVCYSPCPINDSNQNAQPLGDWFFSSFSGPGFEIKDWSALWDRDFAGIRGLGVNVIRVYSMMSRQMKGHGSYPSPWNSGPKISHKTFLDKCWNGGTDPIYVLADIPMPATMYWKDKYDAASSDEITFWENVLSETVEDLSAHPAILGFNLQNEQDSNVVTWPSPHKNPTNTDSVKFWWKKVEKYAKSAKTAMGTNQKLVGMADHDTTDLPTYAGSYMETVPSLDFWGVNSYQTQNFDPVFESLGGFTGYNDLQNSALKPVILTEWGMPATGHKHASDPASIYEDKTTRTNTATMISAVLPDAYTHPLCLGLLYFEYCDEWWNQGGSPHIYTWYGGPVASGFPNGYWDQDGFGLYSVARGKTDHGTGPRLANNAKVWSVTEGGYLQQPATPIDEHTKREETYKAVKDAFPT